MNHRNSEIENNIHNAIRVANGKYDGLICSKCEQKAAEARFSKHPNEKEYGLWFVCRHCGYAGHISYKEKPDGFRHDLIDPDLQKQDEKAWGIEK